MAGNLGYYAGRLEARQTMSENRLRDMQAAQARDELEEKQRSRALMQQAYQSTMPERLGQAQENGDDFIANQTTDVGVQLLKGGATKDGLELLKTGQELKSASSLAKYRNLEEKKAQVEEAGQIAGQITDQATLDEALPELAKRGIVPPPRLGNKWTPQMQEWLGNRAMASETWLKSVGLQQNQLELNMRKQENESKQKDRVIRQKAAMSKENRQRERIEKQSRLYTPKKDEIAIEVAGLRGSDEFRGLGTTIQIQAAKDMIGLSRSYITDGLAKDRPTADAMARQDILNRIDPETGEYKGFSKSSASPSKDISLDSWLPQAQKANPKATIEQLTEYYNKKYKK